jgi:hypothetical protein
MGFANFSASLATLPHLSHTHTYTHTQTTHTRTRTHTHTHTHLVMHGPTRQPIFHPGLWSSALSGEATIIAHTHTHSLHSAPIP